MPAPKPDTRTPPPASLVVLKLGGSLLEAGRARDWLTRWARRDLPVVVVPGGGVFADQVRASQGPLGFDDDAAHRMALLAMAQTACVFRSWCPSWQLGHDEAALRALLERRQPALWCPTTLPDTEAGWHITSDSLAAWLATRLDATRLVLVKSRAAPAGSGPAQWQADGLVDTAFTRHLAGFRGEVVLRAWDAPGP